MNSALKLLALIFTIGEDTIVEHKIFGFPACYDVGVYFESSFHLVVECLWRIGVILEKYTYVIYSRIFKCNWTLFKNDLVILDN